MRFAGVLSGKGSFSGQPRQVLANPDATSNRTRLMSDGKADGPEWPPQSGSEEHKGRCIPRSEIDGNNPGKRGSQTFALGVVQVTTDALSSSC
jgi:hypothetical protein